MRILYGVSAAEIMAGIDSKRFRARATIRNECENDVGGASPSPFPLPSRERVEARVKGMKNPKARYNIAIFSSGHRQGSC